MTSWALAWVLGALLGTPVDDGAPGRWVRHTIRPSEGLPAVLERYGVTAKEVRSWNADVPSKALDDTGTVLRIRTSRPTPPRQRRKVEVRDRDEDTWQTIAARFGVTPDELRAWNPRLARRKKLPRGAVLTLWLESRVHALPPADPSSALPDVPPAGQARSVGRPHRGRLADGIRLPDSDLYTIRFDRLAYGTTLAVRDIQRAIMGFRQETGFDGDISIGAMSRRTGRRLRPHRSHQSGRDADIRLPAMRDADGEPRLAPHEIDWYATWALMDAFVRTGEVQVIFIERKFFRRLKAAGLRLGATDERIATVFGFLRHSEGHVAHMHVRFVCSPAAPDCRD